MLNFDIKNDPYDKYNWCNLASEIFRLRKKYPVDERENYAVFHGAGTGKNRKYFGYGSETEEKSADFPEKHWPEPATTEQWLKENPSWWIRGWAANFSQYNTEYMRAQITHAEWNLWTVKEQIGKDLPDSSVCFDGCESMSIEDHFKYRYMIILEAETAPW